MRDWNMLIEVGNSRMIIHEEKVQGFVDVE